MIKVVDNFLKKSELQKVQNVIYCKFFEWYWLDDPSNTATGKPFPTPFVDNREKYTPDSNQNDGLPWYLNHVFYHQPIYYSKSFQSIAEVFQTKIETKSLIRIKANCYPIGTKLEEHGMHQDFKWKHKGALFALNTCDGYTRFETGEKIMSVENRMIFFDPSIKHTSTNTTNMKKRININFNYF